MELRSREYLAIVLNNLIENAIERNDAETPRVVVSVARSADDGEFIALRIRDNGPGIPAMEREVLEQGSETPLVHGSGLGLWLVYWSVTGLGGTVTFEATEPRGSIVTVRLPAGDASS